MRGGGESWTVARPAGYYHPEGHRQADLPAHVPRNNDLWQWPQYELGPRGTGNILPLRNIEVIFKI